MAHLSSLDSCDEAGRMSSAGGYSGDSECDLVYPPEWLCVADVAAGLSGVADRVGLFSDVAESGGLGEDECRPPGSRPRTSRAGGGAEVPQSLLANVSRRRRPKGNGAMLRIKRSRAGSDSFWWMSWDCCWSSWCIKRTFKNGQAPSCYCNVRSRKGLLGFV